MTEKRTVCGNAESEKSGRFVIPPEAEKEIEDNLFRKTCASADEMVEILLRYGVTGDPDALQRAFLKNKIQKKMSSYRDEEGKRQVLAGKGGMYYVVPLCNNLDVLGDIEQRIQHQIAGLNRSSDTVTRRMRVLRQMLDRLKASCRRRWTGKEESTS